MTKRIFRSIFLVSISIFLIFVGSFTVVLYNNFSDVKLSQLKTQTNFVAQGVNHEGINYFDGLDDSDYRITWIDTDGTVLLDNEYDLTEMENHLQREEVKEAMSQGTGESTRYSNTLLERSIYYAQRLDDGTVIRLSEPQNTLLKLFLSMLWPIIIICIVAAFLSLLLALRLSKKIVKPLNELNLDEPLSNDGYDELSPLLRRINIQQQQIKRQSDELLQKQREFEAVTTGMTEGIVLLSSKRVILSINPAAMKLFGTDSSCVGKFILSVNRSPELQELLLKASNGKYAEKVIELADGKYQIDVSPIVSKGKVSGMVMLLLDVTEKEKIEQMRREFTANVSHELKTPLHTISGCAELMSNGMVKEKDMVNFSAQIYTEAQRMIRLVEDIIKLSHLDEGANDMEREEVNLYSLAKKTAESLAPVAEAADVKITVTGEDSFIIGIPQLLQGIIYNLCDNAIKYNHKGGSVTVSVKKDVKTVRLTVSDTGIGIPAEHQDRIFERFYRVDKSHSKEIGGTGLGLSIVKHAVKLHDANIELQSEPGLGTNITVSFKAKSN